jgi:uncharacterized protein
MAGTSAHAAGWPRGACGGEASRLARERARALAGFHLAAVDEAEYEPVMLFLNHSCEPSAGFAGNTALAAMRDIGPDEELTTDFAFFDDQALTRA